VSSVIEYPPLLTGGFCDIAESDFERLFVTPFNSTTRKELCAKFREWLQAVKAIPIPLEIWIDGSFVTYKPDPSDVDLVCVYNKDEADALDLDHAERFDRLLWLGPMKEQYGCHVIPIPGDDLYLKNIWLNMFGHDRGGMPKGMFKIFVGGKP